LVLGWTRFIVRALSSSSFAFQSASSRSCNKKMVISYVCLSVLWIRITLMRIRIRLITLP
jgi:hypothetical protein